MAAGSSHVITGEYINVEPDGYWTAEVAAGGHQQWSFELAGPREHNILVELEDPIDASLNVWIDGQELGTVTVQGLFTLNLGTGPHAVTINNTGQVPVRYQFYMGLVEVALSALLIQKDDGGVSVVPGGTVVYTLTITNITNQLTFAAGVVVHETVPDHTTFNPESSTFGWSCSPGNAGDTCTFGLGAMVSGTQVQVDFAVNVDNPLAPGVTQIENTASVHAGLNEIDPTPGNIDSDSTPIIRPVGGTTSFVTGGSGSSAGSIALLAGGIAAVVAITAAGGWYTRRRWLGS